VERAEKVGVAVEVELGRLEGGEAGLRMISGAKLTDPDNAETFMKGCVVAVLSFNRHLSHLPYHYAELAPLSSRRLLATCMGRI